MTATSVIAVKPVSTVQNTSVTAVTVAVSVPIFVPDVQNSVQTAQVSFVLIAVIVRTA